MHDYVGYQKVEHDDLDNIMVEKSYLQWQWKKLADLLHMNIQGLLSTDCNNPVNYCIEMFRIWLDTDPNPTWDKLFLAIDKLPDIGEHSIIDQYQGNYS